MRRLLSSTLIITLLFVGCKRDETTTSQGGAAPGGVKQEDAILGSDLLKKMPSSTVGFMVWDTESPTYQSFKASNLGKVFSDPASFSKMIERAQAGANAQVSNMVGLLETFKSMGVVTPEGKFSLDPVVSRAVWFVSDFALTAQGGMPAMGVYLSGKSGVNLKDKVPVLTKAIQDSGGILNQEPYAAAEGFAVKIKMESAESDPAKKEKEVPVFVAATDKLLGASTSKPITEALFSAAAPAAPPTVLGAPEFKRALGLLETKGNSLVLGFLSITQLMQEMKSANLFPADNSVKPELVPFEGVAFNQEFDGGLTAKFLTTFTPKDDKQRELVKRLIAPSTGTALEKLPGDIAFALTVEGKVLSALLPMVPPTSPVPPPVAEFVHSLKGMTIAARHNDAGSPVPDLLIVLNLGDAEKTTTTLKDFAAMGLAANGIAAMQWQEKDVDGAKTSFLPTPLGVGLFLARPAGNDTLVVASSERAVKDALGGGTTNLAASASQPAQVLLKDPQRLGALTVNFNALADLVEGVQDNMAMFMGGQGTGAQKFDTASLRKLGNSVGVLSIADGYVKIVSRTDEAAAKK